jgi:hypothetical protein
LWRGAWREVHADEDAQDAAQPVAAPEAAQGDPGAFETNADALRELGDDPDALGPNATSPHLTKSAPLPPTYTPTKQGNESRASRALAMASWTVASLRPWQVVGPPLKAPRVNTPAVTYDKDKTIV